MLQWMGEQGATRSTPVRVAAPTFHVDRDDAADSMEL